MNTNRTKIDWAYRQALKIREKTCRAIDTGEHHENVRYIAAALRRAYRKGQKSINWVGDEIQ